jgi:hypothetical protein
MDAATDGVRHPNSCDTPLTTGLAGTQLFVR